MNYQQDSIHNAKLNPVQHESVCCFRVSDTLLMLHSTASFQRSALPVCLFRLAAKPRLWTPSLPPLFSYIIPAGTLQLNCKPLPAHQPSSIADDPLQELFPGHKAISIWSLFMPSLYVLVFPRELLLFEEETISTYLSLFIYRSHGVTFHLFSVSSLNFFK